jgi:excisionase family DNA binding protein
MDDLGLGEAMVYQMLDRGIIPNVRPGRNYVITRNAYERWKQNCGTGRLTLAS